MDSDHLTDSSGMSLREVVTVLFLRKWTIAAVFVGVVGMAAFLTMYLISPNFEASSTIIINTSDLIVPLVDAPPVSDFEKLTTFHTQKDVIRSVPIVASAVDTLNLAENRVIGRIERIKIWLKDIRRELGHLLGIERWQKPHDYEAASIFAIRRGLTVESSPESKVLKITLRTKSPTEAADTLNLILENYIAYNNEMITERAAGLTAYLSQQIDEVKQQLAEAELRLLDFRKRDRVELAGVSKSGGDEELSLIGITDSQVVQNELKMYILTMEDELRQLSSELTQSHPRIVDLKKKLASYVAALETLPDRELELVRLERERETLQDSYLFLKKNFDKAEMVAAGNTANINLVTIMEEPKPDETPVSPKPRLTIALASVLGIILGIVCAIAVDFLDHTIRTVRDVEVHLGLRTLGSLRKL